MYTGTFQCGRKHGSGEYQFPPKGRKLIKKEGELHSFDASEASTKSDKGKPGDSAGIVVGQFEDNLPHGRCRHDDLEGYVYDGDWRHGRPHGTGAPLTPVLESNHYLLTRWLDRHDPIALQETSAGKDALIAFWESTVCRTLVWIS